MALLLWAILFLILAIGLAIIAYTGIAIAISFFSKFLFFLSFTCLIVSVILFIIERFQLKNKK